MSGFLKFLEDRFSILLYSLEDWFEIQRIIFIERYKEWFECLKLDLSKKRGILLLMLLHSIRSGKKGIGSFIYDKVFILIGVRLGIVLFLLDMYGDYVNYVIKVFNVDYVALINMYKSASVALLRNIWLSGFSVIDVFSNIPFIFIVIVVLFFGFFRKMGHLIPVIPLLVVFGWFFFYSLVVDAAVLPGNMLPWGMSIVENFDYEYQMYLENTTSSAVISWFGKSFYSSLGFLNCIVLIVGYIIFGF